MKVTAKFMAIFAMAFLLLGAMQLKDKMKLYWDKRNFVVELVHRAKDTDRQLWVNGMTDSGRIYSSYIQVDGEKCPTIHLIKWRDVPKIGIMVVQIINETGKILFEQKFILGPPLEEGQ